MRRRTSESSVSLATSRGTGAQLPAHGAGPYSLVDSTEVQEPLVQEAIEHEEDEAGAPHTAEDLAWLGALPWYRRPHPAWLYPLILFFSLAGGILLAPRLEMYLALICDEMGLERAPSASGRPHIPSQACRQSPAAQRQLSTLQLVLLLTNGVGCAFSAGFWSRLSDRTGRNVVMMVNILGILIMDIIVLIVARVPLHSLPMGAYFLAIGSTIEGSLGGYSAVNAMSQCYISDVTPSGTRARLFSLMTGVMFAGIAVGPTIGGYLTVATGDVFATLWTSTVLHASIVLALPFFPESLSRERREKARQQRAEARDAAPPDASLTQRFQDTVLAPLHSLRILKPEKIEAGYSAVPRDTDAPADVHLSMPHSCGARGGAWDINLLLIAAAYFLESATIAIVPIKIQYVQLVFNWDSEMLGFFMSFTALTRMVMLVVVLPVLLRLVHRPLASIVLPQDAQDEAHVTSPTALDAEGRAVPPDGAARPAPDEAAWTADEHRTEQQWTQRAKLLRLMHDSRMDVC